jgi:hypothetical protein
MKNQKIIKISIVVLLLNLLLGMGEKANVRLLYFTCTLAIFMYD